MSILNYYNLDTFSHYMIPGRSALKISIMSILVSKIMVKMVFQFHLKKKKKNKTDSSLLLMGIQTYLLNLGY